MYIYVCYIAWWSKSMGWPWIWRAQIKKNQCPWNLSVTDSYTENYLSNHWSRNMSAALLHTINLVQDSKQTDKYFQVSVCSYFLFYIFIKWSCAASVSHTEYTTT